MRVQLSRWLRTAALGVSACGGWVSVAAAEAWDDPVAASLFRWFSDSGRISVRSWMGDCTLAAPGGSTLALHWNNENVRIPAIAAAPGTQEAVDAITTASRPISGNAFEDFVKTRNEVQGELTRGATTLQYYVSSESDYLAQQLGARYNRDLDDHLNLSIGTSWGWDRIDPLDDDDTSTGSAHKATIHADAVATRVLSPTTLLRVGVEYNVVSGLQHNPYRNVYAGGGPVAERHPDQRERRDVFLKLNQYLSNRSSVKLGYRLYNDDWGITSHEVGPTLSQYVSRGASVRWSYRWYTQTSASFYRAEYASPDGIDGYRSGDYRMSALSSHLFGAALDLDLDALAKVHRALRPLGLTISYERYFNSNNYSANILETGLDYRF
jgi:hypothetical protein